MSINPDGSRRASFSPSFIEATPKSVNFSQKINIEGNPSKS